MVSHPQGTGEGAIAEYDCDDEFMLNGSPNRQCLPSGLWSGVEPTCQGELDKVGKSQFLPHSVTQFQWLIVASSLILLMAWSAILRELERVL